MVKNYACFVHMYRWLVPTTTTDQCGHILDNNYIAIKLTGESHILQCRPLPADVNPR